MAGEQPEVVLLSFWCSPFAMKARIALAEKGVPHEIREENLPHEKSNLLLRMNPVHKKVPVLIHKGKPVCESSLIVQYIDEVWTHESPLLPSDPHERARARFWVDLLDKTVLSVVWSVWFVKGEPKEGAKEELMETFKLLESELGKKDYFGGARLGYLDVSFLPYYLWIHQLEKANETAGRETELKGEMEAKFPNLEGWMKRCMLRESVSAVLPDPDRVSHYIRQIRKMVIDAQA
ncbi:hypothetical protein MLD38_024015 [Melastoma candidum]|uniref:Uncharacterized protein n=1 Tax=Melastoma candidum TaxID=119954 RepID=A0ACB9NR36_9MYRT|nr:hypothetical protein MLD38_024015 [Melastoma candidum]